jgi:hypothetical protein
MLGIALSLVPCLRRDWARGCTFTTKFRVVLHDLMHQMFGHLLADEPIPLACQFCDGLCEAIHTAPSIPVQSWRALRGTPRLWSRVADPTRPLIESGDACHRHATAPTRQRRAT